MNSRLRMRVYRTTHLLHWISAAVCFAALLLFTVTGITLNHAGSIGASPRVTQHAAQAPEPVRKALGGAERPSAVDPLISRWLEAEFSIDVGRANVEWSAEELYLSAPGPGRDAWVSVDRASGAAKSEVT